jgi:replication factor C small subunit
MSLSELLWAEKYRPRTLKEIADREEIVKRLVYFVSSKNMPHMLFVGSPGTSKTTAALALVNDLYNGHPEGNYIELNASDERGIDMVRSTIKDFARSKPIGDVPFKIIILDECDSMTEDAQHALRRTMEKFTTTARFILIANFLYRIIEPIQSRCSIFRFTPLDEDVIKGRLAYILSSEKVKFEDEALDLIVKRSRGDMRWAINIAQAVAASGGILNKGSVLEVVRELPVEDVKELVNLSIKGKFSEAQKLLVKLLFEIGLSGRDITRNIHEALLDANIEEETRIRAISSLGEAEYRITQGADPEIQIAAVLAQLSIGKKSK